ncbi:hypothetical protein CFSAN001090_23245, partial [Salmonella enterica subsp. enterica serovar Bareilly str. CFSAN001090]
LFSLAGKNLLYIQTGGFCLGWLLGATAAGMGQRLPDRGRPGAGGGLGILGGEGRGGRRGVGAGEGAGGGG